MTRSAGPLAVILAAGVAAVVLVGRADRARPVALPVGAIEVRVGGAEDAVTVPADFLGLSTEYSSLTAYTGPDPAAINPLFVQLVRNLAPGGSPLIRIGGDTTDWTWWPLRGRARPPWVRYVLTPRWIAVARALARAARARLILGINFEADNRALVRAEAGALLNGLGRERIAAFELGNEPEVYGQIGWYAGSAGRPVLGRPPSYRFDDYLADFRRIGAALPRTVPVAGPALALSWPLSVAARFLAANPRVRMFTFHFYPLKRCFNAPSSPTFPTLAHLLARRSAAPPAAVGVAVGAAHSRGARIRVDEFNSVSCRGLAGLSDTFASALWAADALFAFARAGVDGVNVHTLPDASYAPFAFVRSAGRWQAHVNPLYYGMLLFTRAAPAGARLLQTIRPPIAALRTWATRGPGATVRVLLINESDTRGLTLAVRPPHASGAATLARLLAPGLSASSGITLAGQSYGAVTATGTLSGRRSTSVLEPVKQRYVVSLPAAGAALLTLRDG